MWWPTQMWHWQLIGFCFLSLLSRVIESKAAMRGCRRQPIPVWLDKALRVAFLGVLAGPTCVSIDMALGFPVCTALLVLYMIPYTDLCEQSGGWNWLPGRRMFYVRWFRKYFDVTLIKTVDLDPKTTYIFGVHPHGILPIGAITGMNYEDDKDEDTFARLFPGVNIRTLAATFCFYLPGYREILLSGGVVDAARYSANRVLELGYSLSLVPGGATEALYNHPDHDVVYIKNRYGFVKLALEAGASLVPCFSFNECNTYGVLGVDNPTINSFRKKFQSIFGISLPLVTNVFPKKTAIRLVIGEPIQCPKTEEPSREQVQAYLDKYIASLEKLYNDNKDTYNTVPKPPLQIM
eukprot:m.18995 g.18995  ORF g.18995 m.18995 type:complete len:350 (+) comp3649_c0_seq2:15-1064(+)